MCAVGIQPSSIKVVFTMLSSKANTCHDLGRAAWRTSMKRPVDCWFVTIVIFHKMAGRFSRMRKEAEVGYKGLRTLSKVYKRSRFIDIKFLLNQQLLVLSTATTRTGLSLWFWPSII